MKIKIEFDEKKETDLRTLKVGLRMGADEIYDIFVRFIRDKFSTAQKNVDLILDKISLNEY